MTHDENRISDLIDSGLHERSAIDRAKYELYLRQQAAIEEAAQKAWEEAARHNPNPYNPYAYVYGFKAGAQTILENPGEWGLVTKAQHDHYMAKYTSLVEWYDRLMGTPCEQVRHQQEIESLQAQNDRYRKALEDVIIRLEEDKRFNALSIAKEALNRR